MKEVKQSSDSIDWTLTTYEGARVEQMRRWAALPLERVVAALEEMEEFANKVTDNHREEGK